MIKTKVIVILGRPLQLTRMFISLHLTNMFIFLSVLSSYFLSFLSVLSNKYTFFVSVLSESTIISCVPQKKCLLLHA